MPLPTRTLKEIFALVRQNLSMSKEGKVRLTDNIIWTNANLVLSEIHQIICDSGSDHYEKLSGILTSTKDETESDSITTLASDVYRLRRIWEYDATGSPAGLSDLIRSIHEQSGSEIGYEIIENKLHWTPISHSEFKYKLEYLRTPTAMTDLSSTPDIPGYADDAFLTTLTARCALLAGAETMGWFELMNSTKRQLVLHCSNVNPKRQTVFHRIKS